MVQPGAKPHEVETKCGHYDRQTAYSEVKRRKKKRRRKGGGWRACGVKKMKKWCRELQQVSKRHE